MINFLLHYPFCVPALFAAMLGLLFPAGTILFMLWHDHLPISWANILALHRQHLDLMIIWLAPIILSLLGSFIGKTSLLLKQEMDSLKQRTIQLNIILDLESRRFQTAILSF